VVDKGLENLEEVATERGVEDVFVQKFKKLFQKIGLFIFLIRKLSFMGAGVLELVLEGVVQL
jgi:hypothetical protein